MKQNCSSSEKYLSQYILTGWKRIHNCEETPYITRMQRPFDISHTRTVLSIDEDAMYWLLDEKSKSENKLEFQKDDEVKNKTILLSPEKLVIWVPCLNRLNYGFCVLFVPEKG